MTDTLDDLPTISSGDSNEPLFTPSLVLDSRLDVKSSLGFAIQKSAQNITMHSQRCSSATTSGVSWDCVVPSLSTVIDRKMVIRSRLTFTVACTADLAVDDYLVKWGVNCALAPCFPFQSLCSTISTVINNSNYTFESADLLQQVTRLLPKDILDEYSDICPTFLDNYAKYSDTVIGTGPNAKPKPNSPFGGYADAFLGQQGRGSYNLVSIVGNDIGTAGAPGQTKSVTVEVVQTNDSLTFRVIDEGAGFDYMNLPDPTAPENIEKENGRGIFLIQNLSDCLDFEESGKVAVISFDK